jgi:tetratricopeptide (TPR) repeat protein
MLKFKLSIILLVCFFSSYGNNSNYSDSIFNQANSFYQEGEYLQAKEGYLNLNNKGFYSLELYLNLGNAYFKLDSIPHAILYYEKGMKVAPGNKNLIHNLKICNAIIKDKFVVKESIHINDWIYVFLGKSTNYWANASIILMLICFSFLALFLFSQSKILKKATFYSAIGSFILSLFTVYFAWLSNDKLQDTNYCILFTAHVSIKAEPSSNAENNYKLHEGSKMKIIDENTNWLEISFDEKIGWIEKKDVKRI